jgi:V8-like Glu-specific endopeptidase
LYLCHADDCRWVRLGQRGTGFRIGSKILLTAWHVLHAKEQKVARITAEFGYDDDGSGGGLASSAIECVLDSIRGDPADDWAIVEVKRKLADSISLIKLSEAVDPHEGAPAFIIQHPGGDRKRLGYVRNQITSFDNRVVHYLTDTQTGSSGSPVLDDKGRLLALHHAGGRLQEIAGRAPLRKNEGIRIPRIMDGLLRLGMNVA